MRVPRSWLTDFIDVPADATLEDIADAYVRIGIEPEAAEVLGSDIVGPIVVGRVLSFVEEPQSNGKTIRWCQVEIGPDEVRGIVCGALNFLEGDKVVVSLPGAVLPGGFAIAARKTYGHVSDGMICSARELGMGDDHHGIIRLSELGLDPELGEDAVALLGLRDEVIELNVLPDSGHCMSIRGAARELAHATGWAFRDLALGIVAPEPTPGPVTGVRIEEGADHIVLCTVDGFDPSTPTPIAIRRRLQLVGVRPISFAVDVTNYVMFELGQPLHAFDRSKLQGDLVVRRATEGEALETLDHVRRALAPRDVVIADDRGPVALAGTMGGLDTEIDDASRTIVIEAAHFDATAIGVQSRRHGLISEASKRFERGIDSDVQEAASARAVQLLVAHGGATYRGATSVDVRVAAAPIAFPAGAATRLVGYELGADLVVEALTAIGCAVASGDPLDVTPPTWRPDLTGIAELVEEVARYAGYDRIPSVLPVARGGRGLTARQRLRRRISRSLAYGGLTEVVTYPFIGNAIFDDMLMAPDDGRRDAIALLNPLSAEAPLMRTTLLATLLGAAQRNVSRGMRDLAIYEMGLITQASSSRGPAPQPGTATRPTADELAAIAAAIPAQPEHVAAVLVGARLSAGPLAPGREAGWSDAIALAGSVLDLAGVPWRAEAVTMAPWHPGRCAAIVADGVVVGHAGELHPKVSEAFGLPRGASAFELSLETAYVRPSSAVAAQPVRTYPVALQDLAFLVSDTVPVATLRDAIVTALGDACESVRCFDEYRGAALPEGHRSLAFAVRLRAADRTLTERELADLRAAAVAAASALGATLR